MKDFIELLKKFGLSTTTADNLLFSFYIIVGLFTFYKGAQRIITQLRKRSIKKLTNQDLHPYFTYDELIKFTKYYIPQYFQNITPTEGDEPGSIHAAAARSKLMPEFLKKGLLTQSPIKYFIILADTGMGKTAFLVNLFRKYKQKSENSNTVKYKIALFPLGSANALNSIKELPDKQNTILLLDAFDEDIKAVADYKSRMEEILAEVQQFRKIIFTCRTQFFPSQHEEPSDTDDITFGENNRHSIHKLYLSTFDNTDIFKYLLKKYQLRLFSLYQAYKLVKKCPNLMFRPMLLTYIDDLILGKLFYTYSFEMYDVLIDKWVQREAQKPAIRRREDGGYSYENKLRKLSMELAVNLYTEREKRAGYAITLDELKKFLTYRSIGTEMLSLSDTTGRSLLNRNSLGQIKFAHKSILEYFLAKQLIVSPAMLDKFDFHGMDATENFLYEMLANRLKLQEGTFVIGERDDKPKNLSTITPKEVKQIKTILFTKIDLMTPENFAALRQTKRILYINSEMLPLYVIYLYILREKSLKGDYYFENGSPMTTYSDIVRDIKQTIPDLDVKYIRLLLNNDEIDKVFRNKLLAVIPPKDEQWPPFSSLEVLREAVNAGRSERALVMSAYGDFLKFKKIKKILPDTEVIF